MAKILIAEDVKQIREILADTLSDAGHDVIEASNGGMALEKACQEYPDLVLLDIMMPVMDGFEVLRELRKNPDTNNIQVVLLTAMTATQGEHEALGLGATHYITKPWDEETLQTVIRVALRGSDRAAGAELGESEAPTPIKAIHMGELIRPLEDVLGGGLQLGFLTLMEGPSAAGKSVLSQNLAHGALVEGYRVGFYSSRISEEDFPGHMRSLGLRVASFMEDGQLTIYRVQETEIGEGHGPFLTNLAVDSGMRSSQHDLLVVDDITSLAAHC